MSTSIDEEKLESVLYETSNVILYSIPPPTFFKVADHVQEYHDINKWNLTRDNIIFKGILRVKEQEFFGDGDDSDDDEATETPQEPKTAGEEALERFRLIVELISFEDLKVWATIKYYCLSPMITTVDNTSFHSIQLVNNSNLFSTFIESSPGVKIGCGLKFPNRIEANNFQMVLSSYLKDFHNYTEMIQNNRQNENENKGDEVTNTDEDISTLLRNTQLIGRSKISVKEVDSTDEEDDDDDDDFGDFVG